MPKVCFCIPVSANRKPHPKFLKSLEASIPLVVGAGWEERSAWEIGHAYVSYARTLLVRKAIMTWIGEEDENCVFFLDDDVSHGPEDLLKVLQTPGDIVGGTYRLKSPGIEEYMGRLDMAEGEKAPKLAANGCYPAFFLPAGFLKVTRRAIRIITAHYPDLDFSRPHVGGEHHYDLFQHGVMKWNDQKTWFGEDYAFSIRWKAMGRPLWLRPDLQLDHEGINMDGKEFSFPGNFLEFMLKREAGKEVAA